MGQIKVKSFGVKLSLIDDFNKLSSKGINTGTSSGGDVQDWLDRKNGLISNLKASLADQENVISFGDKLKQSFKGLGIDTPANINKEIEGAKQWQKEISSIISKLNSFNI